MKQFSRLADAREPWRAYPLSEALLLTCATIASCDDFDDIVGWGERHLDFLRKFAPFHHGVPGARWLRALVNRADPALFGRCFEGWIKALWPERRDRRHRRRDGAPHRRQAQGGLKAPHALSADAANARLALAQLSAPEKINEITAC